MSISEILDLFKEDFKTVVSSKHAVYKSPDYLYENLINEVDSHMEEI